MAQMTTIKTKIGEQTDAFVRIDKSIACGAEQNKIGGYANAVSLLNDAKADCIAVYQSIPSEDLPFYNSLLSQLGYEYAHARDTAQAQQVIQYISDATVKDETLQRIAIKACEYNLSVANNVISNITDTNIKDETLKTVSRIVASTGNETAFTINEQLSDEGQRSINELLLLSELCKEPLT